MTIIELLDHFIDKYEDLEQIAEVQYHHAGHNPSWYKDMKEYHSKVDALKEVKEVLVKALEKAKAKRKKDNWKVNVTHSSDFGPDGSICWSNYRVVMVVDEYTHKVQALFWTPQLEEQYGVQNSHHDLMMHLEKISDSANLHRGDTLVLQLHWCGFYTFGYGNNGQKQLTLYGESSDYPHTENSEKVKEAFLAGKPFELGDERSFTEMISGMPDELFDQHTDSTNE